MSNCSRTCTNSPILAPLNPSSNTPLDRSAEGEAGRRFRRLEKTVAFRQRSALSLSDSISSV